jgi:hypothetical protein
MASRALTCWVARCSPTRVADCNSWWRACGASITAARSVSSSAPGGEELHAHASALEEAAARLLRTTEVLLLAGRSSPALMMANSHEYLNMAGHMVIAWRWLEMNTIATQKRLQPAVDTEFSEDFYIGKQMTARFFFRHELPKTVAQAELLMSLDDTHLVMQDEYFG